ncbi:MAG: MarC family protein, partial [Cytophagia bacterium]|nr:MarC family protein [Cytophagia bacterium]
MDLQLSFKEIFSVTLVLFAVIDILGSVPIVIDLKIKAGGKIQSGKATIVAGIIMILFLFLGESILSLFGVDFASFAIAGAIVIFFLALEMVLGVDIFKQSPGGDSTTSIVPLA